MATPAEDEPQPNSEGQFHFQFHTPFGTYDDIDDLPQEARAFVIENLASLGLPDAARAFLENALNSRARRRPRHAAKAPALDAAEPAELLDDHLPGCTCEQDHRTQLWGILDTAFPRDPHLWRAGEALFALSAANPVQGDLEQQRAAAETAARHLEHHAARLTPAAPPSPAEELIERFRRQLDM